VTGKSACAGSRACGVHVIESDGGVIADRCEHSPVGAEGDLSDLDAYRQGPLLVRGRFGVPEQDVAAASRRHPAVVGTELDRDDGAGVVKREAAGGAQQVAQQLYQLGRPGEAD